MRAAGWLAAALLLLGGAEQARADVADYLNLPITAVRVQIEGRDAVDPTLLGIVETRVGTRLSMIAVRAGVTRLFSLGRFEDVQVQADRTSEGVNLTYNLVPLHPVQKLVFSITPASAGVDEGRLRQEVVERYGAAPSVGRAADVARLIEEDLGRRGYLHPVVTPRADVQHSPDRTTLVFGIEPGGRTLIGDISVVGSSGLSREALLDMLRILPGAPYQSDELDLRIARYVDDRRSKGYFEAKLAPETRFSDRDRVVDLTLNVAQGPHVRVVFSGDPLPDDRREELVPIEREGSVNEDLLEDSSNRIEDYLRGEGYRDATAPHERKESAGEVLIGFTIKKGPQYRVARVEITGNAAVGGAELEASLRVRAGQPLASAQLDADVSMIEGLYRRQGFAAVDVQADVQRSPDANSAAEIPVTVSIVITENVRTLVNSVRIQGNASVPEADLEQGLGLQSGAPFFVTQMAIDRDLIQVHYANLGFQSATVETNPGLSGDGTRADVVYTVHEGPRLFVDHILIVGNVRTKNETIERELQFKSGDPLGVAAVTETQRRLVELGLFRRTEITAVGHGERTRDVLISLDEAPVTTVGYGVGVEVRQATRSTVESGGAAEQHLEFAPRAFFEIGRSNLFGKNRSINLFSRVSLRRQEFTTGPLDQVQVSNTGRFGFVEYRILGTFREPKVFDTPADAFLTGTFEQQARSSFNFARRAFNAEIGRRLTPRVSATGNYQIQRIELFDEHINPLDKRLIDRVFPEVRLSSFSSSVIRNTKDDAIDPSKGQYLSAYGQIAARGIGSEVGFAKSFLSAQTFHTLTRARRTVFAGSARLGTAVGFPRPVTEVGPDGRSITVVVKDLPASERFFAGGDTTVRGFALDQVGTPETIDADGFPIGGNALVIFNAELRVPYRNLQFVGFFDSGNVFSRPSQIDLWQLRSSTGVGIRYRSPVGPIRVDLGFKMHRYEVAGQLESLTAIHISLGQAF